MQREERLSIQELRKRVHRIIGDMKRAELLELLNRLAEAQDVENRPGFLSTLERLSQPQPMVDRSAERLNAAERLKEILEEAGQRQEYIENGDYDLCEDWDDDRYNYYDDSEPEALSEDHWDEIRSMVQEADDCFLDRKFEDAGRLYRALIDFQCQGNEDDLLYGGVFESPESWHRHLRCIYENWQSEERISRLYDGMAAICGNSKYSPVPLPSLRRVIASSSASMPGYGTFLPAWENYLSTTDNSMAKRLWVEVLALTERWSEAFAWLESNEGKYPEAWLEYLECLKEMEKWGLLAEGCKSALDRLSEARCRETVADLLICAGKELGNKGILVEGYRAAVLVKPCLGLLESMTAALPAGAERRELLAELDRRLPLDDFSRTHATVKFLQGKVGVCLEAVERKNVVGWSIPETPLPAAVCGGMIVLCACGEIESIPEKVRHFVGRYLSSHCETFRYSEEEGTDDSDNGLVEEIFRTFQAQGRLSPETQDRVLEFTKKAVSLRADHIVSNTHRNAYERAAAGLIAWAETARLLGKGQEGDALIRIFRGKYPRHRAFRAYLPGR